MSAKAGFCRAGEPISVIAESAIQFLNILGMPAASHSHTSVSTILQLGPQTWKVETSSQNPSILHFLTLPTCRSTSNICSRTTDNRCPSYYDGLRVGQPLYRPIGMRVWINDRGHVLGLCSHGHAPYYFILDQDVSVVTDAHEYFANGLQSSPAGTISTTGPRRGK